MINQIKAQLKKSYENNARKSRIDNLVTDLVSTLSALYASEENIKPYMSELFVKDIQAVIDKYASNLLNYEPEKKAE